VSIEDEYEDEDENMRGRRYDASLLGRETYAME